MRTRLKALGAERAEKSRALVAALAEHPAFLAAKTVALFAPLPSEPDVEPLWEKAARRFCVSPVRRMYLFTTFAHRRWSGLGLAIRRYVLKMTELFIAL